MGQNEGKARPLECNIMLGPYLWFLPQGCYEKVKLWFDDNKHVLGTVGMCILIMQVRRPRAPRFWMDKSPSRGSGVFTQPSLRCAVSSPAVKPLQSSE